MNAIDPNDPQYLDTPLWCVYGPDCFPTMFACRINNASGRPAIWGYSVYKRSPGYRTLGREVRGGWVEEHNAKFFTSQDNAIDYLRELTTPKCDVHGNKIKKPTKKQQAIDMLKRIGAKKRTLIYGDEREVLLDRIKDLTPIDSGTSLHWWSEEYVVDGKTYEIGGAHGSKDIELVELVEEIG